ncbi:MAG TPA: hypothetical protein VKV04_17270 [Verrucomicrobiae bacterium]|nr:hypothetical protein [Verrucomicrobiae bacterium]
MKNASKLLALGIFVMSLALAGCSKKESHVYSSLKDPATAAQLKQFITEKKLQASAAADKPSPEFDEFLAAAERGDWVTVSNRLGHLLRGPGGNQLSGPRSAVVREVWGALEAFGAGDEKYSALFGNDIIHSIPPGSIYFGGTDPGRFVVTAMQKSQVKGDPFFTLTQNAMADGTYLDYLRSMYDGRIYTPTAEDSQRCFQEYMADAEQRQQKNQLKPGEIVTRDANGHVQVSGQVSVMEINGLICKVIVDKNPDREFYIEESFPLDWMYPYLEPHGIIFKLNHQPVSSISDDIIQSDHDCWTKYANQMIGGWLHDDTSVKTICEFAEKVFLNKHFGSYGADRRFIENADANKTFSKERSSIGGLYVWRAQHATGLDEKQRMTDAADFAFRQAFALCPYSPEAVYRYSQLLVDENRGNDAYLIAETAAKFKTDSTPQLQSLAGQLRRYQTAN